MLLSSKNPRLDSEKKNPKGPAIKKLKEKAKDANREIITCDFDIEVFFLASFPLFLEAVLVFLFAIKNNPFNNNIPSGKNFPQ